MNKNKDKIVKIDDPAADQIAKWLYELVFKKCAECSHKFGCAKEILFTRANGKLTILENVLQRFRQILILCPTRQRQPKDRTNTLCGYAGSCARGIICKESWDKCPIYTL